MFGKIRKQPRHPAATEKRRQTQEPVQRAQSSGTGELRHVAVLGYN